MHAKRRAQVPASTAASNPHAHAQQRNADRNNQQEPSQMVLL
jgi:hypothetical protein